MTPKERNVIRGCRAILLDFDGPVCSAFAGYPAPQVAHDMLMRSRRFGIRVSVGAEEESDPMEVLRYLFKVAPKRYSESEKMLRDAEVVSVKSVDPTPGAVEFIKACKETGRPIVVVSNNSPESVSAFLKKHDLANLVGSIFGRSRVSPDLMKPNPHLLRLALKELSVEAADCLMVGDSVTDIEVAKSVGVPVAGYANRPEKVSRFHSLGSDVVTTDLRELAGEILASRPLA